MASWKTTLFGILAAVFTAFVGLNPAEHPEVPAVAFTVAKFGAMICTAALGFFARDNNVSSEKAGAK